MKIIFNVMLIIALTPITSVLASSYRLPTIQGGKHALSMPHTANNAIGMGWHDETSAQQNTPHLADQRNTLGEQWVRLPSVKLYQYNMSRSDAIKT